MSALTTKESSRTCTGSRSFLINPRTGRATCVHYPGVYRQPRIPYRPHPSVYIAISELVHLRSAGISSPYFSQPQPELLICHRQSSFRRRPTEGRMDVPRLIAAPFYRRRGDASLRLPTLSRVKFKSLHAWFSLIWEDSKVFFCGFKSNSTFSLFQFIIKI